MVGRVHKQVRQVRHGPDLEEMGGTKIDGQPPETFDLSTTITDANWCPKVPSLQPRSSYGISKMRYAISYGATPQRNERESFWTRIIWIGRSTCIFFLASVPQQRGQNRITYYGVLDTLTALYCMPCLISQPPFLSTSVSPRTTDRKLGFFDVRTMSFGSHCIRRLRTLGAHEDALLPPGLLRIHS